MLHPILSLFIIAVTFSLVVSIDNNIVKNWSNLKEVNALQAFAIFELSCSLFAAFQLTHTPDIKADRAANAECFFLAIRLYSVRIYSLFRYRKFKLLLRS